MTSTATSSAGTPASAFGDDPRQLAEHAKRMSALIGAYLALQADQVRCTRDELTRLRTLIDAAAGRLLASFATIGTWAERSRAGDANRSAAPAVELEQAIGDAVGALQFHDLSSQLLEHVAGRIAVMEHLAEVLGRQPTASVDELAAGAQQAGNPQRPNPVAQDSMAGGAVELF